MTTEQASNNIARIEQHYNDAMTRAGVPDHLHRGLIAYFVHFKQPGDFLTAVLENNLRMAFARADAESFAKIGGLARFLIHNVPSVAWGSPAAVRSWLAKGSV